MRRRIDKGQAGHASTWIAILLVIIGTYFVLMYLPPWYKSWKAKDVIGEVVAGTNAAGASREVFQDAVVRALNGMGIDITAGDVQVNINDDSKEVDIEVTWKAVINYPLTSKTTSVTFSIKTKRKLT